MTKPTPEQIAEAGRQLQRGGILGRGSSKLAEQLVEEAGEDKEVVAFQILSAATDHQPRPRGR